MLATEAHHKAAEALGTTREVQRICISPGTGPRGANRWQEVGILGCVVEALIGSRDVKSDEHGEHFLLFLCYALVSSNAKNVHPDLCLRRLQFKYGWDILTSKTQLY